MTENKEVEKWIGRIGKAKKKWDKYHELIKTIREYYTNESDSNKQNIFWSSIETLKPFIYFKSPVPYIESKDKKQNPVADMAVKILERALEWDLSRQDFDGVIKYARNDYLLSGLGLTYEQVNSEIARIQTIDELGNPIEIEAVTKATVDTLYFDPKDFICDCQRVKVWEDVSWVAQKIEMTKREVIEQFGEDIADELIDPAHDKAQDLENDTCVWRIWDKKDKQILYVSEKVKDKFLRADGDVLGVEGFYPFPKPVFATLSNNGVIPVPDYTEIKCLLDELDGVNDRMSLTMKALKVSGCYDSSMPELANLLAKDVKLVSIDDFAKVREQGGIKGFVDFMPIEQYINALTALAERRQMLINAIYEITGVSDIMRGNSDPNETATAVTKKTNFGTLRNQDRQNDFQRYLTDVLKIKAELICEQMPENQLAEFALSEDINLINAAIALLKQDKIRNLVIGIETDSTFNQSQELEQTQGAIEAIHTMITQAFQAVSAQPALLPLYKQMLNSLVATLPSARQFATAIDETFAKIEQELNQPDEQDIEPNPDIIRAQADMLRAQAEQVKNANEFQVKQEANAIKQEEARNKAEIDKGKLLLANKEMDIQENLKNKELILKGETNENVTTGFVGAF